VAQIVIFDALSSNHLRLGKILLYLIRFPVDLRNSNYVEQKSGMRVLVRIKVKRRGHTFWRHFTGLVTLLTPVSLAAFVLAAWRLAADIGWAGSFAIARGPFSHWMVWTGIGLMMQFVAATLGREITEDDR
jgi:hypothetical protein